MEVTKGIEHCPYCNQDTEVGTIEMEDLIAVKLCSECHCWEVFNGRNDRLIRNKYDLVDSRVVDKPETNDESLLCPMCWRKMIEDWPNWVIRCPDPICGYNKRLPGLSKSQREAKAQYISLRDEIFELANGGKEVPPELEERYKDSQSKYNLVRKFDLEKV